MSHRNGTAMRLRIGSRLLAAGLALLVTCLLFQACTFLRPSAPIFLFVQQGSGCATQDDTDQATVSFDGSRMILKGTVITPTPCHHLIPDSRITANRIDVSITSIPQPGACMLCLGAIGYEAQIADLQPGTYTLRVRHHDRLLQEMRLSVSLVP